MLDDIKQRLDELLAEKKQIDDFEATIQKKQVEYNELSEKQRQEFKFETSNKLKELNHEISNAELALNKRKTEFNSKNKRAEFHIKRDFEKYAKEVLSDDTELDELREQIIKSWLNTAQSKSKHQQLLKQKEQDLVNLFELELNGAKLGYHIGQHNSWAKDSVSNYFVVTDNLLEQLKAESK